MLSVPQLRCDVIHDRAASTKLQDVMKMVTPKAQVLHAYRGCVTRLC